MSLTLRTLSVFILAILLAVIIGCAGVVDTTGDFSGEVFDLFELNTKVKIYTSQSSGKLVIDKYKGYRVAVQIQAVKPHDTIGIDDYRITLSSRYEDDINKEDLKKTKALQIDSLQIYLPDDDRHIYPKLLATDFEQHKDNPQVYLDWLWLMGPTYRFETVVIGDKYETIEVSYILRVLDRESGEVTSRQQIEHTLTRIEKLEYYH